MPRPRTVYRGKRKYSWLITLAGTVVVLLIVLAVWLFYSLQRYIVYDKDGLRLDLSAQKQALTQPDSGDLLPDSSLVNRHIPVEIVVDEKDYSQVTTSAGTELSPLRAAFIPAAELTENTLKYYGGTEDFSALVLELKDSSGALRWHSKVPAADSFAVNGTLEPAEALAGLKERGIAPVARISALADDSMARRNSPLALKNAATEAVFVEGNQAYLDPYNEGTRAYLLALLTELKALGFDEVLLSGFVCPDSEYLRFSSAMSQTPNPSTALCSLADWLRRQADALELRLSLEIEAKALRSETVLRGQDPALLFRFFDRIAVETDPERLDSDLAALSAALGGDDENRVLLITEDFMPERESYIVK